MKLNRNTIHGIQVIEISGRFDAYEAPAVKAAIADTITTATNAQVVVNLAGVNFIDSTALATLVQGMKHSRELGGDLHLCSMQQPVRIIFELTRLDKAFSIFADEETAVAGFVNT